MPTADLIIHNAGQLVTCASGAKPKRGDSMRDVGIVENGAVAIEDGRFVAVGMSEDLLDEFSGAETIDAEGQVVCPGFVDAHTHIVYAGDRLDEFELKIKGADYLDILAAGGGIISTVTHTRSAPVGELVTQALKRLDKMLACGTTTCEIKTGYGLDTANELKMLEVIDELAGRHPMTIVPTLLAAHAIPPEFVGNPEGYVTLIHNEIMPLAREWYEQSQFAADGTPFFADVFTERSAFDVSQSGRLMEKAASFGFRLKAHVDQFTNLGGTRLAVELGAASVDHLDAISPEEIEQLAGSDTVGIVIPTENFSAAKSAFAPARKMIDAGCAIAITTDYNPGSAPCPSLPMAMAIAARYQKILPAECFNAATINAAFAIGMGERVGSIEAGKFADVVFLDTSDYRDAIYEFGGDLISRVYKSGRRVL